AIGHLHDACFWVGRGGTRLGGFAPLLSVVSVVPAKPRAMRLDLCELVERRVHARLALARGTILRSADASVAGVGIVISLLFEPIEQPLGLPQLLVQLLLASKRTRTGRSAHPHSILDHLIEI